MWNEGRARNKSNDSRCVQTNGQRLFENACRGEARKTLSTTPPAPRKALSALHLHLGELSPAHRQLDRVKTPCFALVIFALAAALASAAEPSYPPELPGGAAHRTDTSADFLKPSKSLQAGVQVAKAPPTIDFVYFPGQDYAGNPWSNWGDSLAADGKYYASIGDHLAPAGNAFVYEYDPARKNFRELINLNKLLKLPKGHYAPGKIHSRLDLGKDGWLYCSTHRGSTKVTSDKFHYRGDWIVRCHPETGKSEIVVHAPIEKHCIPASVLDPQRLIFYGGTAPGDQAPAQGIQLLVYDIVNKKLLYSGDDGPARYMILAKSTGRMYYVAGKNDDGDLMRFDPKVGKPEKIPAKIGLRAATDETPQGIVYTVSSGQGKGEATLYAFDVKSEQATEFGPAAVGSEAYIASIDADPTGRYLYYVPGAHGSSDRDNSAVVQYDVQTKTRKVIAFVHPFYADKVGCALKGTYSTAVDPAGDKLYITWNANRAHPKSWDTCALTVIHIPESERPASATKEMR